MQFKDVITESTFNASCDAKTRDELFYEVANNLKQNSIITDVDKFVSKLKNREVESSTALPSGIAIPHGKDAVVKQTSICFYKLNQGVEWDSSGSVVDVVFMLVIPESKPGQDKESVKLLARIATLLMNKNFAKEVKSVQNLSDLHSLLIKYSPEENVESSKSSNNSNDIIVAVTACATGIAHTYMAADALQKIAQEIGVTIHVEKQGANGIEDRLSDDIISNAKGVILATDVALQQTGRFEGKQHVQVKVAEAIKHPEDLIRQILDDKGTTYHSNASESKGVSSGKDEKQSWMQAIMTGISYMIPVLVSAGVIIGIGKLGAAAYGIPGEIEKAQYATDPNRLIVLLHFMSLLGGLIFKFMYPVFGMFVAFSIANRSGLIAGFVGGLFSAGIHFQFFGIPGVPSGFIGAAVLGLSAGYIAKFLNDNIHVSKDLQAIKPMFLIPAISVLSIFFLNYYVVEPIFGGLNLMLQNFIRSLQAAGTLSLSAVIAAATSFDLGGPVNKAAGAIAIGLAADHIFPLTPRVLAIVIPPIGLGLATVLDIYVVRRRVFSDELQIVGKTSLILGFLAVSEGALPFLFANPLITIPINIIGAVAGACTAVYLGAIQWYPLPAVWGWPLVENVSSYIIGLAVGAFIIAFANIFVRFYIIKKSEDSNLN